MEITKESELFATSGDFIIVIVTNNKSSQYIRLTQCSNNLRASQIQLEAHIDSCVCPNNYHYSRSDARSLLSVYSLGGFIHSCSKNNKHVYFHLSGVLYKLKKLMCRRFRSIYLSVSLYIISADKYLERFFKFKMGDFH